jgi:hypothetical protein
MLKRCQPCWCSLKGAGPWKCLYIGTNQSWFAMISQWVNNSRNLKELRSCCLTSGYGRMGRKGGITLRNFPWWCEHTYQVKWTSGRLAGSADRHDHSRNSSVGGFHSLQAVYAVLTKGVGCWPHGSAWAYETFLLSHDPVWTNVKSLPQHLDIRCAQSYGRQHGTIIRSRRVFQKELIYLAWEIGDGNKCLWLGMLQTEFPNIFQALCI